ncbi:MAG: hypothetical protein ABIQ45_14625 [Devosia sp.]|uniref:hypothetical protein n=1 Tax=Devosia sp. TaxID=1871048 RepID=UPI003265ED76
MTTRPLSTLADFRVSDRTITAYCSHYWVCSHDAQLRLDLVASRLGWGFDFFAGRTYLASRLYCSICGWYKPTFSLGHASKPKGFAGSHGAGFEPIGVEAAAGVELERRALPSEDLPWVGARKQGRKFGRLS